MITWNNLISATDIHTNTVEEDFVVKGIAYDSRHVQEGFIFVAIKGFEMDGHDYIKEAVEKGAKAIVLESPGAADGFPFAEVKDSRIALAELSSAFYGHPSADIKVIGVTATNGKTSTTYMIDRILAEQYKETGLVGTVVTKIGDLVYPSELTTPQSTDLQEIFFRMKNKGISHATMEVSSSALDLHRVHGIDFDIVSLNNISREHIDLHDSFEQYAETKSRLITEAGPEQFAILNLDDDYSRALIGRTSAKVVTISTKDMTADLYVENLDLASGKANFDVVINEKSLHLAGIEGGPSFSLSLQTSGLHSVYNALVAIAAALLSGVPVEKIQKGLEAFEGVERRFELVYDEDFKIIDDHFANGGNIDVTLGSLMEMDYQNLILVYAIRGKRGITVNKENAEKIALWSKKIGYTSIIATKSVSNVIGKDQVTEEEENVFMKVMEEAGIKVDLYEDLEDAIAEGLSRVNPQDIVLLAGAQGMDYGCEIALNILRQKQTEGSLVNLERKVGSRTLKLVK